MNRKPRSIQRALDAHKVKEEKERALRAIRLKSKNINYNMNFFDFM